jgi:site-specific recombinase XerD
MFEQLFVKPHALARHSTEPLADERRRFLVHLKERGLPRVTLRSHAAMLLRVADVLHLADRPGEMISRDEIDRCAASITAQSITNEDQATVYLQRAAKSRQTFRSVATRWLRLLGRLKEEPAPISPYAEQVEAFADYLQHERRLSARTINNSCAFLRGFLGQLDTPFDSRRQITVTDVDRAFAEVVSQGSYTSRSIQNLASHLRVFLRYAERLGWCRKGLADSIRGPRTFTQQSLPTGPSWDDVRRLLAMTEGDRPVDIRDRAILMLFAIYGLRRGEVGRLQLNDLDWEQELLTVVCSKTRRTRLYPLVQPVGNAILRYLKEVRPQSPHREVFLSLLHPIRPLGTSVAHAVRQRLRQLGVVLPHYGPHALRHACAAHLLAHGMTLKEIGDHLGHCKPDTTRIYAKVDLAGLRQVADFDLGGLL